MSQSNHVKLCVNKSEFIHALKRIIRGDIEPDEVGGELARVWEYIYDVAVLAPQDAEEQNAPISTTPERIYDLASSTKRNEDAVKAAGGGVCCRCQVWHRYDQMPLHELGETLHCMFCNTQTVVPCPEDDVPNVFVLRDVNKLVRRMPDIPASKPFKSTDEAANQRENTPLVDGVPQDKLISAERIDEYLLSMMQNEHEIDAAGGGVCSHCKEWTFSYDFSWTFDPDDPREPRTPHTALCRTCRTPSIIPCENEQRPNVFVLRQVEARRASKTHILRQFAESKGLDVADISMSTSKSVDLMGVPTLQRDMFADSQRYQYPAPKVFAGSKERNDDEVKETAIKTFANRLARKLVSDNQACHFLHHGDPKGAEQVIEAFLSCESTEDSETDWIGATLVSAKQIMVLTNLLDKRRSEAEEELRKANEESEKLLTLADCRINLAESRIKKLEQRLHNAGLSID